MIVQTLLVHDLSSNILSQHDVLTNKNNVRLMCYKTSAKNLIVKKLFFNIIFKFKSWYLILY